MACPSRSRATRGPARRSQTGPERSVGERPGDSPPGHGRRRPSSPPPTAHDEPARRPLRRARPGACEPRPAHRRSRGADRSVSDARARSGSSLSTPREESPTHRSTEPAPPPSVARPRDRPPPRRTPRRPAQPAPDAPCPRRTSSRSLHEGVREDDQHGRDERVAPADDPGAT